MDQRSRVHVFDTTLRDGEQAPGFSMTPAGEAAAGAATRPAGRGHHRGRLPHLVGRRFRGGAGHCAGGAAAESSPGWPARRRLDIDRAWAALAGAARPRIHVFLATSDIHLEHKLRIDRASRAWRRCATSVSHARALLRRRGVLGRGCDAQRPVVPVRGGRGRRRGGRHHDQPARHRRATRCPPTSSGCSRPSARASGDRAVLSAALPQRPRAWPWPTRSRPCRPGPARWSAPSTASASAPATRRSRRS